MSLDKTGLNQILAQLILAKQVLFSKLSTQWGKVSVFSRFPILKIVIPILTILVVLYIGVSLGTSLNQRVKDNGYTTPKIPTITPTPIIKFYSAYEPLRQTIQDFNPSLPDPISPQLDYDITIDPKTN